MASLILTRAPNQDDTVLAPRSTPGPGQYNPRYAKRDKTVTRGQALTPTLALTLLLTPTRTPALALTPTPPLALTPTPTLALTLTPTLTPTLTLALHPSPNPNQVTVAKLLGKPREPWPDENPPPGPGAYVIPTLTQDPTTVPAAASAPCFS